MITQSDVPQQGLGHWADDHTLGSSKKWNKAGKVPIQRRPDQKFVGLLKEKRRFIMTAQLTSRLVSALGIALATATFSQAWAQDSAGAKTREEVRAELIEAQRIGDIMADGETGKKLNELYPHRYPAVPAGPGLTRAQVMAELAEAQRRGDILADGETGKKLNELYPNRYPVVPAGPDLRANR